MNFPNDPELILVVSPARFVWLKALRKSARKRNRTLSVISNDFTSEAFTFHTPGKVNAARLRLPGRVLPLEKAEHFLHLDGFSLDGSARRKPLPLSSGKTRRTESTSTSIPLLPIAPISPRMRSDSDSSLATSTASLPRPSTPLGTIRKTWCPDHAEDIGRGAGIPVPLASRCGPSAPSP